jgi:hypothetical protein
MENKIRRQIAWMAMLMIIAVSAMAIQPNPEIYWGFVYLDSNPAPNGTRLTIESGTGELFVNTTIPINPSFNGSYSIQIPFDDKKTNATDEGADDKEELIWKTDGIEVVSPINDTAEKGQTNNNFTVTAVTIPQVIVSDMTYNSQLLFGQRINSTIQLNNTGKGTGNVTIQTSYNGTLNLSTNLPQTFTMLANTSATKQINLTPNECGAYSLSIDTLTYDKAGRLRTTKQQNMSINALAPDLTIVEIINDATVTRAETLQIHARVQNNGTYNITGFNTTLSVGGTTQTSYANYTLAPGENLSIGFTWDADVNAGNYTIIATVSSNGITECKSTNNELHGAVTVEAQQQSGGSSGGGSSGGHHHTSEVNETLPRPTGFRNNVTNTTEPTVFNETEKEEQEPEDKMTSMSILEIAGGAIDFPALLLAFITLILIMTYINAYNMKTETYEAYTKKIINDPSVSKQYSYVPFEYLMQAADVIDAVYRSKGTKESLTLMFEKEAYSPIVTNIAIKAARTTERVMKSETTIREEIADLKIGSEGYDYIDYNTFTKAVKLMAELFRISKDEQEVKRIVKLAIAGLGKIRD